MAFLDPPFRVNELTGLIRELLPPLVPSLPSHATPRLLVLRLELLSWEAVSQLTFQDSS